MRQTDIANKIYRLIAEKRLNQAAIGRAIGMSPQQFNDVLRGRKLLRTEHIDSLCRVLDCEPNELFGYKKETPQIVVTKNDGGVVAVVAEGSVIEHEGYHVVLT